MEKYPSIVFTKQVRQLAETMDGAVTAEELLEEAALQEVENQLLEEGVLNEEEMHLIIQVQHFFYF